MFNPKDPNRLDLLAVELESDCDDCLVFNWVTKGSGFGMTIIWEHEVGVLTVSDECMGKKFVASVVETFARQTAPNDWPIIMRRYEGPERLMAATVLDRPGEW